MDVCFSKKEFTLYVIVLVCITSYFIYIYHQHALNNVESSYRNNVESVKDSISSLQSKLEQTTSRSSQDVLLNKIYNPLITPDRVYPGGRNVVTSFQMVGYAYNDANERFPLFGRPKYANKTDKWEYYLIDESRNKLKIVFKSKNDNELYDNDVIDIPTVGNGYNVKIYEYEELRYNEII